MPRKLIVFADGTGNAFTQQESNIWRMYQALAKQPDQIARYIPGVGTSSIKMVAALDGAIGFGVPENVRKLYRFLCWNWRPGDEIYLFGFSRGAFTVRALAGMIASQGLMPARITDPASGHERDVTHDEMARNSMAAWRAYREETASWQGFYPNLWISRPIRNAWKLLWPKERRAAALVKQRATEFAQWQANHPGAVPGQALPPAAGQPAPPPAFVPVTGPNGQNWSKDAERLRRPPIRLLGVYDTVEAFGVPIDELRPVIDRFIWPIRFRNRLCSPIIDEVRHAIALDDERTTFHPVRFERDEAHNSRTRFLEVWFAGVHSDVGGGYPDDGLAHLPLVWMIEEVSALQGGGLAFDADPVSGFRARATYQGPLHDSRAGASVFYRYAPRMMERGPAFGWDPIVHRSVQEKMNGDTEKYAPVPLSRMMVDPAMPKYAKGITSGAPAVLIAPDVTGSAPTRATRGPGGQLFQPSPKLKERALDYVWWRRVNYFAMLFMAAVIASLPLTALAIGRLLDGLVGTSFGFLTRWLQLGSLCAAPEECFTTGAREGLAGWLLAGGALIQQVFEVLASLVPSFAKPWLDAVRTAPMTGFWCLLALYLLYRASLGLKGRIVDTSDRAWKDPTHPGFNSPLLDIAQLFRTSTASQWIYLQLKRRVLPLIFGLALLFGVLVVVNQLTIHAQTASGDVCRAEAAAFPQARGGGFLWRSPEPGKAETVVARFDSRSMCWPSGIKVSQGRSYLVWLESDAPLLDDTIATGFTGFTASLTDPVHGALPAQLFRRWPNAPWFQPIIQIGDKAITAEPLQPLDGAPPIAKGVAPRAGKQSLAARFKARADGPLYLYLNDAMIGLPLTRWFDTRFYRNNVGTVTVTVQEEAAPPRP